MHANAFIISTNCKSERVSFAKSNLERAFPGFFSIHCFQSVPLTDIRINPRLSYVEKQLASNFISFNTILTKQILQQSSISEHEWSFIFDDDVNFIEPERFSLKNYIDTIQELMRYPEIQYDDGFLYLGIHQGQLTFNPYGVLSSFSNGSLFSSKGHGLGTYAVGLTKNCARTFIREVTSFLPIVNQPMDMCMKNYYLKSGKTYFILGSNVRPTADDEHFGIAYKDRERYPIGLW